MSKFIATSRNKPCLSCGDISGKCRHQAEGEIILCMSANSGKKGDLVDGGYKIIDSSQDGLWAILKPDNTQEWAEERRREWADEQRRRRELSQWEQQQKLARLLPIADRDKQYRRVVAKLGVNQKHHSELSSKRGLTNGEIEFAIAQGWICSWKPGFKIEASPQLAGVANGQLTGVVGLGIAAVNPSGEVVGFQLASDNRAKFGKYIWLSSASKGGNSPHLPNGELPVFVWRHPEAKEITESWLVEGSLKSLITALKLWFRHGRKDIQIIGAAGANWLGSINAVTESLAEVSKVVLCPDAGSLANFHILGNYRKIIDELASRDYLVDVAWWGQFEKAKQPDIDELSNTLDFQLITPREFLSYGQRTDIDSRCSESQAGVEDRNPGTHEQTSGRSADCVGHGQGVRGKVRAKGNNGTTRSDDWKLEYEAKRANAAKFKFTRKSDVEVKDGFLPTYNLNLLPRGIIGIKGDWGVGKSFFTANLCKQFEGKILQVAHLNAILYNTSPKYGLIHHQEAKRLSLSLTSIPRLAICDVSLAANFSPENWAKGEPFILIWDEICQGLKSLHTNKNLKGNLRVKARIKLEWLIKNAAYVIAADRDLDDETLDYLERVRSDGKKSFIIHHTAKKGKTRKPITINCNKKKDEVLSHLIKDAKAGIKLVIACENKSDLLPLEKQLLEAGIPENVMFFAHGDNSNEPHIKPVIQDIDKQYTDYQIVGYTMTMGTAVSLEKEHFNKVYGFFSGDVIAASDQCQMLFRYRPDCEIYIWVSPRKRTLEIDPNKLLNNLRITTDETNQLITSIDEVDKLHKQGILPTAWGEITEADLPFIHHKLSIKARIRASLANPFQTLYDLLAEAGFTIKVTRSDSDNTTIVTDEGENHTEIKKEIPEENDRLISASELMDELEYESAKINAGSLPKKERDRLQKTQLHRDTGLEITQDIVKLQRTKKLTQGARMLKVLLGDESTAVAFDLADRERNPDIGDQSFYGAKRRLLVELGTVELIAKLKNESWSYTNDSPEIQAFADKVRARKIDVKRLLGFTVSLEKNKKENTYRQSNTTLVGMVLDTLCILRKSERPSKGNRHRIYSLDTDHWALLEKIMTHIDTLDYTPTLEGVLKKAQDGSVIHVTHTQTQPQPEPQVVNPIWQTTDGINELAVWLEDCDNLDMIRELKAVAPISCLASAATHLKNDDQRVRVFEWLGAA